MVENGTCPECGEEIGENTNFCPSCGADLRDTTGPQIKANKDMLKTIFSKTIIALGTGAGIFLAWLGITIFTIADGTTGMKISAVLNYLGFACVGTMLISGGVFNSNFDKYTKLAMILGGALILAATLGIGAYAGGFSGVFG